MTSQKWTYKMTTTRKTLIILSLLGIALIVYRYIFGLGAATNLNDQWPWGLWIAFDVLLGVALAGGGYGTALIIHVLHKDKFYPIGRSAMLTSLLGYLLVGAGVLLDVGRYFNVWVPFVSWGYHSVMFEVFVCITFYTFVQILEFGEILTERIGTKWHTFFKKILPVLLIIGVVLPTLHQSSLGGLYLTQIGKLHPLWYSELLPIFFLLSSFFVGPAMIAIESSLSGRAYSHQTEIPIIRELVKIAGFAMIIYLALKTVDLVFRDALHYAFSGSIEGNMFLLELGIGVVVPVLICFTKLTTSKGGLIFFSACTATGVILNRMNVVFTGMAGYTEGWYFPSWMEFGVSVGLIAIAVLLYTFIVENFKILDYKPERS